MRQQRKEVRGESERQSSACRQRGLIEVDERAAGGWWVGQREGGGDTHYKGCAKFPGMRSGCGETPSLCKKRGWEIIAPRDRPHTDRGEQQRKATRQPCPRKTTVRVCLGR